MTPSALGKQLLVLVHGVKFKWIQYKAESVLWRKSSFLSLCPLKLADRQTSPGQSMLPASSPRRADSKESVLLCLMYSYVCRRG